MSNQPISAKTLFAHDHAGFQVLYHTKTVMLAVTIFVLLHTLSYNGITFTNNTMEVIQHLAIYFGIYLAVYIVSLLYQLICFAVFRDKNNDFLMMLNAQYPIVTAKAKNSFLAYVTSMTSFVIPVICAWFGMSTFLYTTISQSVEIMFFVSCATSFQAIMKVWLLAPNTHNDIWDILNKTVSTPLEKES